jgi:hypothetical protein
MPWARDWKRVGKRMGIAYVTPQEGAWLAANGLYQPGHTTHRYSTPGEDLSDATQAATSDETEG